MLVQTHVSPNRMSFESLAKWNHKQWHLKMTHKNQQFVFIHDFVQELCFFKMMPYNSNVNKEFLKKLVEEKISRSNKYAQWPGIWWTAHICWYISAIKSRRVCLRYRQTKNSLYFLISYMRYISFHIFSNIFSDAY